MASGNHIVVVSRFKEAANWADDKTHDAVKKAIDAGEREANIRIEKGNTRRGYNLSAGVDAQMIGTKSGMIEHPDWFMKFFEFGTVFIDAIPFMRPGHRKMRAVFKDEMGDLFKGFRSTRYLVGGRLIK